MKGFAAPMAMHALESGGPAPRIDPAREGLVDPAKARVLRGAVGGFEAARIAHIAPRQPAVGGALSPWLKGDAYLVMQLAGAARFIQKGRDVCLNPGDIALFDSEAALRFWFAGRQLQLVVCIPRELMADRWASWETRCAYLFRPSGAALVSSVLRTAFEQVARPAPGHEAAIAEAFLTLVVSALDNLDEAEPLAPDPLPAMARAIQDSLISRLDDTGLTPAYVAKLHGVSERQLHRLFQTAGISLGQWIRAARLDRCAADLRNASMRERTITEIAFGRGFNDAAHFSRTFRAEYGQSPREYRAAALPSGPTSRRRPSS
jgi:AraC-like DNA-binding protein